MAGRGLTTQDIMRRMLEGFLNDPPDTEYQRGFLAAILTISNEVIGTSVNDPVWEAADRLLKNFQRTPSENESEAEQCDLAKKKIGKFDVIKGGKE